MKVNVDKIVNATWQHNSHQFISAFGSPSITALYSLAALSSTCRMASSVAYVVANDRKHPPVVSAVQACCSVVVCRAASLITTTTMKDRQTARQRRSPHMQP